jgi:hypothetical protein
MTDLWVYDSLPANIRGNRDDGNLPFHFEPPANGGHLRIVQSNAKPAGYDPATDPAFKPLGPTRLRPDGVWDRGGQNFFSSPVHKSATVDYGILLEGERTLILDHGNVNDAGGRCGGSTRQLARLDQSERAEPDGLRHDGGPLRWRAEGLKCLGLI